MLTSKETSAALSSFIPVLTDPLCFQVRGTRCGTVPATIKREGQW